MGGWTPLVEVDSGGRSESEQAKEIDEQEWRSAVLIALGGIADQLCLLNARIEEAFETNIEETDT